MAPATVVRGGILLAGSVITLVALLLLTWHAHWFQTMLLVVGLVAIGASLVTPESDLAGAKQAALRDRLRELEALREDGTLTAAEYRRKREQLLEAWGLPGKPPP